MEDNSIYILKNYGVTKIKLKEILLEKGISRNKLCSLVGANFDLINRYYNNSISRVDLDIISRFCYVLNCNISDILEYTPSNEK
ncbi:MAG: helix-turn-helix transcriptional regulator [Clostridia bacterium]|nr:helix-turn-helix transcriptional regulator [Clostridia bacterium]